MNSMRFYLGVHALLIRDALGIHMGSTWEKHRKDMRNTRETPGIYP